jgi:hypothetical protein
MTNFINKKEWKDFDFYPLKTLNVFLAVKNREANVIVDEAGNIIFRLPKIEEENHWFNLDAFQWESPKKRKFNQKITYWTYTKCTYPKWKFNQGTIKKTQIFTYKNDELIEFLEDKYIIQAYSISPTKLVLQIALDTEENKPFKKISVEIFDTETQELKPILQCNYFEDFPIQVHEIDGTDYLFSVYVDVEIDKNGIINNQISYLYNTRGERIFDFELSAGRGRETHFEQSKKGFGITYKLLPKPLKRKYFESLQESTCLIDKQGNFYGEFSAIAGQLHNTGIKNETICPKFFEGKLLCTTLPTETDLNEYLIIIDKEANQIETKFELPLMNTRLFNQFVITDRKIFGCICLIVIDSQNMVQLINLNGTLIPNIRPIAFEKNFSTDYKTYFINQLD